jgi:polyisoprenoid-binding protein YceI
MGPGSAHAQHRAEEQEHGGPGSGERRFREVSRNGTVSADGDVSRTVTVAASIDTKNARRDAHPRSADLFDSGNYPGITITAYGIQPSGRGVTVTGAVMVPGRTLAAAFRCRDVCPGTGEIWLHAEVVINRAGFGLNWNQMGTASMHNTLTIHAVFTRR